MRRLWRINRVLVLTGVAVAAAWVYKAGGREFAAGLMDVCLPCLVPMVALTAVCILMRFVRWQFLLRRAGIRLPTRRSLSIYLASLAGIATPAHLGELVRALLIRRRFGVPVRATAPLWVLERLLDAAALGALGSLAPGDTCRLMALLGLVAAAGAAWWARPAGRWAGASAGLSRPGVLGPALLLSLGAWAAAAGLMPMAARSVAAPLPAAAGVGVFSMATLLGSLALTPAGLGTTGSLALWQRHHLGLTLEQAVVIVTLVRMASAGLTLAVGGVFLLRELRGPRPAGDAPGAGHFEQIAAGYPDRFPAHLWDHLLERRSGLLADALPAPSVASRGLDLGCGIGQHGRWLARQGYRVIGVDAAAAMARRARAAGVDAVAGQAGALPFPDERFDFVYAVGVLHHLPDPAAQAAALVEVRRVLRPGGRLIVQETNPRNPLFRFYMGYVFPLLRDIDEGTECWIEPAHWQAPGPMKCLGLDYFTFLPDFLPRRLMRSFLALERRLEAGRLRTYSVHYMAVLEKR